MPRRPDEGGGSHPQGVAYEDRQEVQRRVAGRQQQGHEVAEHGAARRHPRRRDEHQPAHRLGPPGRQTHAYVAAHRVADEVRAFQSDSLHPHQEPRHGFGEYEPAGRTAHASEAGQVHQVDTVTLRKGRHVPGPPAGGAGDPVYQHDRLSFASRLVADRPALYVDVPP